MSQSDLKLDLIALEQRVTAALAADSRGRLGSDSRFAGVSIAESGKIKCDVWSDGLTLADKQSLERILAEALRSFNVDQNSERDFYVNFRRQHPVKPVAAGPRKSAFGIQADRRAIPGVTHILAVASGKGGVGKSTTAVNLAVALAAMGKRVGILDADIYGPSVPVMLGLPGPMQVNADAKLIPLVAYGVKAASFGFLTDVREPAIWRGPMISKAFSQLAYDVAWGDTDILVIDLPPGTGDVQLAMLEQLPVRAAVVVTTPQTVALHDAHKALGMFRKLDLPVAGIIENMATHTCSSCGHEDHIFGQDGGVNLASEYQVPMLGRIPIDRSIRTGGDTGAPCVLNREGRVGREFSHIAESIVKFIESSSV